MKGRASRKVEGGKLLKVNVETGYIIENVKITGDFFLHPEESIEDIENAVLNCHMSDSEGMICEQIKKVVKDKNIQLVGITSEAIASVVKEAFRSGVESSIS